MFKRNLKEKKERNVSKALLTFLNHNSHLHLSILEQRVKIHVQKDIYHKKRKERYWNVSKGLTNFP